MAKENNGYVAIRAIYFMGMNTDQEFILNMWAIIGIIAGGVTCFFSQISLRISTLCDEEIVPLVTKKD